MLAHSQTACAESRTARMYPPEGGKSGMAGGVMVQWQASLDRDRPYIAQAPTTHVITQQQSSCINPRRSTSILH